jgi:uncharacterized radical SAM superfamily Fe-S cluster-containing enzyme
MVLCRLSWVVGEFYRNTNFHELNRITRIVLVNIRVIRFNSFEFVSFNFKNPYNPS